MQNKTKQNKNKKRVLWLFEPQFLKKHKIMHCLFHTSWQDVAFVTLFLFLKKKSQHKILENGGINRKTVEQLYTM